MKSGKTESQINDVREIIDNIVEDITSRLKFEGHLIAESLFDTSRYEDFAKKNSFEYIKNFIGSLSFSWVQTELEVIYSRQEFRSFSNMSEIFKYIKITNLMEDFPEVYKLLQILLTIPMTTADAERRFSTLKKIKTETRNRMSDSRQNAMTAISSFKCFFDNIDTQDKIIDMFANHKNRKLDLIRKH